MPLVQTRGAASAQGFGEFSQPAAGSANYIDDVFSTYLYTGNGSTQTITNGIDLTGKGGLVWTKTRVSGNAFAYGHVLCDTVNGAFNYLRSNTTDAITNFSEATSFNSDGFNVGNWSSTNINNGTYCSWTFREQAKFFDVVTFTGTGSARTVAHNLGSVPGMMIVKKTDSSGNAWFVYHRSTGNTQVTFLNTTDQAITASTAWDNTSPTSSVFTVGTNAAVNASGGTYVAYLFAHDAGGFGAAGTDNVISCGSFTTSGETTVTLGYEPQYVLVKRTDLAQDWQLYDTMRGMAVSNDNKYLEPNSSDAESNTTTNFFGIKPTATGFVAQSLWLGNGYNFIYMAIRRPMKPPTSGTQVFKPVLNTGTGATKTISGIGFAPDAVFGHARNAGFLSGGVIDRLRGVNQWLATDSTGAEGTYTNSISQLNNDSWVVGSDDTGSYNYSTWNYVSWNFRRASGFMDVCCYTGTGSATTQAHNLGAVPELIFVKNRSFAGPSWCVYSSPLGNTKSLFLDNDATPSTNSVFWNNTSPTSSVFSIGTANGVNRSTDTFVAYLFATVAGVSKVGSYTGNGSTQAIACGFTGGARFVLIKRTDATGDWYVYDTARGMTTLTDPYLLLNSTAAESATLGSVTTTTGGFTVDATILAAINTNAASYIFLAIA